MAAEWAGPVKRWLKGSESSDRDKGATLEFRLIYEGALSSGQGKHAGPKEKHEFRRQLHPQLRELWRQDRHLKHYGEAHLSGKSGPTYLEHIAKRFSRGGTGFIPLITEATGYWCSLNVLFLRRDMPGYVVDNYGDLDNRLKILFDALAVPTTTDGLPSNADGDENPIYCLLENDRLITLYLSFRIGC